MSDAESYDDFTVHTVPGTLLERYLNGEPVRSSMTHEYVKRPPWLLYAMQHEHQVVRLIWRRP